MEIKLRSEQKGFDWSLHTLQEPDTRLIINRVHQGHILTLRCEDSPNNLRHDPMGSTPRVVEPTGIEQDGPGENPGSADLAGSPIPMFLLRMGRHLKLKAIGFRDQTDMHNELVFESEWLLHPSDSGLALSGNLFIMEDALSGNGLVLLKEAPLPHSRPIREDTDLRADWTSEGWRITAYAGGVGPDSTTSYPVALLPYEGGEMGATLTLQGYQRNLIPNGHGATASFITNTWGDRNRDSRICHDFILREMDAGKAMGADVVQMDDGWQKGRTANSAESSGVWEGFWDHDQSFWDPDPIRFPEGLEPILSHAAESGLGIGLWFAPDSSKEFENWERDAETLLGLYNRYGIRFFKVDGIKARTRSGELNLRRFFDRVLEGSDGRVVFDLDVTAEVRPGYFGMMDVGPIFVENRYTDWTRYWPHQTLRNLWKLSRFIHPRRLRMEFLNNRRNTERYEGDPLAPKGYLPETMFATVMMANPLGWFEASSLDQDYLEGIAGVVGAWKSMRAEISGGAVLPIGIAPDGLAWTGFCVLPDSGPYGSDPETAYILAFRELNPDGEWHLPWGICPGLLGMKDCKAEVLSGHGSVIATDTGLEIRIPMELGYLLVKLSRGDVDER